MVSVGSGTAVWLIPGTKPPAPMTRNTIPKMSAKVRVFMIQLPCIFVFLRLLRDSYRNNGPVTSGVPARGPGGDRRSDLASALDRRLDRVGIILVLVADQA